METNHVLGISFSTRLIGLAVLSSYTLVDCSVKLYKDKWTEQKWSTIRQALQTCIEDYNIRQIVLSIPPHYYQTDGFMEMFDAIHAFGREVGIPVEHQNYKVLYSLITTKGKANKKALLLSLVHRYPRLNRYYEKERRNKKVYYTKMFEAIAIVILQVDLNNKLAERNKG